MRKVATLPPEFDRAMKFINKRLLRVLNSPVPVLPSSIWESTNNLLVINKSPKIRDIPHGMNWRWNQAKNRYKVSLDEISTSAEILKLVPRKTSEKLSTLPKLKLWQVKSLNKNNIFTIYWCEKGADSSDNINLKLKDFSFLAEFIEPEIGKSLWPEHPIYKNHYTESFDEEVFIQKILC